jgi:long-chain acyl-CoA synthetase
MAEVDTLPKFFVQSSRKYGDGKVAMRKKELGIWREFTWKDSYERVKHFCLGLVSLGLRRGEKVTIIGDNDPQYYWAELAIQAAGGTAVGIFTDCIPREVKYFVNHCDAVFVLAKDQEQCDKLLEIKDEVPKVKRVIYWDPKGLWNYEEPWLMSFEEVESLGRQLEEARPGLFERMVEEGKGDDIAIFCYTSGTTALPKGAMIAHRNLIAGQRLATLIDPWSDKDEYVSFSPLAWITEHVLGLAMHVISGMVVNFPEKPETVREDLREIAPQVLLFSSRLWENVASMVQMKISESSALNRFFYNLLLPIGYKVADMRFRKEEPNLFWKALYALADLVMFRPLRDKIGLLKVRAAYTAGAALNPDVLRFFQAIGVNLKQLFGSTEAIIHTLHRDDDIKVETVGPPVPGVKVAISEEGEILVKSDAVFCGYYKNPDATRKALKDGWFHTGDAGYFDDDGHLIYLDRVKDLLELAGGAKFSPQYIEGKLKFSPYIRDTMVVGGKDKAYVTAIVNIDFDNVGEWAEKHHIAYTTFVDLSQKPEVYDLIRKDVERVNSILPPPARVRKFVLLHKEFDPDEAELTRTRKLRRTFMESRYQNIIEAMYRDRDRVMVQAEVKYRDGRTGVVETAVKIYSLDEEVAT